MSQDPEGETLIRTLVQLGKALAIETLAEGIEQSRELSLLKEEQCDSGQGFLFARPLELDACEPFLRDWIGGATSIGRGLGLGWTSLRSPLTCLRPLSGRARLPRDPQ